MRERKDFRSQKGWRTTGEDSLLNQLSRAQMGSQRLNVPDSLPALGTIFFLVALSSLGIKAFALSDCITFCCLAAVTWRPTPF